MSINTIGRNSPDFPIKLSHLHKVPEKIYHLGASLDDLLAKKCIGIVGSRKVSSYGRGVTHDFSESLARNGVVVVSGLALGVDSIAHQAAIDSKGRTIAVLPGGIEKIYPASHRRLAINILKNNGALLSEYSGKSLPMKHQFIERNRIIAALSDALLITEAAENSGSLHTAQFALELGKPVLTVPGNITSATSAGTNNLIKTGAIPVTSTEDIFEAIGLEIKPKEQVIIYGDNDIETNILNLINEGISEGSQLLSRSKLSVEDFQQNLTLLEIKGRIKPLGNDHWSLR